MGGARGAQGLSFAGVWYGEVLQRGVKILRLNDFNTRSRSEETQQYCSDYYMNL